MLGHDTDSPFKDEQMAVGPSEFEDNPDFDPELVTWIDAGDGERIAIVTAENFVHFAEKVKEPSRNLRTWVTDAYYKLLILSYRAHQSHDKYPDDLSEYFFLRDADEAPRPDNCGIRANRIGALGELLRQSDIYVHGVGEKTYDLLEQYGRALSSDGEK